MTDISDYWAEKLINIDRVKVDDLYQAKLLIYTGNLSYNKGKKSIFEIIKNESNYVILKSIGNNKYDDWKIDTASKYELPFIPLVDFVIKHSKEGLENIITKSSLEALSIDLANFSDKLDDMSNNTQFKQDYSNEDKNMSKTKQVLDKNTSAIKSAAKVTVGTAINNTLTEKVKGQLPLMVRGYADTALGRVVVANIADYIVNNFAPYNKKAQWATEAMMVAAMTDFMASFDIESIIGEVLKGVDIPEVEVDNL